MSVASEIARISKNVSDSLDAVATKGVTVSSGSTSDDLAGLILQITGGVGGITQDQDGYLVLSPDAPSPAPSGGLEFETGTWTPSENVVSATVPLLKQHDKPPMAFIIADAATSDVPEQSMIMNMYFDTFQGLGSSIQYDNAYRYGFATYRARTTGTSVSTGNQDIRYPYTNPDATNNTYSRYWATESSIRAYSAYDTRYWRSGRTYKWIAVWAPST